MAISSRALITLAVVALYNCVCVSGQCSLTAIELTATASDKTLSSPNHPNPYSADSLCSWKISAGEQQRISLTIETSVLEDPYSDRCSYDYAVVKDGDSSSSDTIVQWCGSDNPKYVTSTGQDLFIQFASDSATQHTGFLITYRSFDVGECPGTWVASNDSYCYHMRTDVSNWEDAQNSCIYDASNLISLGNSEESELLKVEFTSPWTYVWMGLEKYTTKTSNRLKWIDRSTYSYQNWTSGYPGAWTEQEKCPVFDLRDGSWLVQSCYNEFAFICKKSSNGRTVGLLPGQQADQEVGELGIGIWAIVLLSTLGVLFIIGGQAAVRWKLSQRNQTFPEDTDTEKGSSTSVEPRSSSKVNGPSSQSTVESPRRTGWADSDARLQTVENIPPLLHELDKIQRVKRKRKKKLPPVRRASTKRSSALNSHPRATNLQSSFPDVETPPGAVEDENPPLSSRKSVKKKQRLPPLAVTGKQESKTSLDGLVSSLLL